MIISRTPLRISFFGGGTDFPLFFEKEFGCVISASINKYVYLVMHDSFDEKNKLVYSKLENVSFVDDIENTRIREAMKRTGVTHSKEIHSIAEVPAGTGLGSSSSFTVGLLNLLYSSKGKFFTKEELAKQACEIEINVLKEPIGKQDQYAASIGGLNYIQFNTDGSVFVEPIAISDETLHRLNERLILFYMDKKGDASDILSVQNNNVYSNHEKLEVLRHMKSLALKIKQLLQDGNLEEFGQLLDLNWKLKKSLVEGISDPTIDEIYDRGRRAGALGGKVLGAGGRGFMLFFCEPEKQPALRSELHELREFKVNIEREGTKIIYSQ